MDKVLSMPYLRSYKLKQLHMQVLLYCHLAAFYEFEWTIQKSGQMKILYLFRDLYIAVIVYLIIMVITVV